MERHRFFSCLIGVLLMLCTASPARADMKSLTDDQMGAVQGHSGTIASAHADDPQDLTPDDTPGIVNTTGATLADNGKTVYSPGSITTDIHPGSSSPDVLFSISMNVESVTYRSNNTRMVEGWSGNRVDFQSLYMDMNQ
ncbi:hypothetical protein [uncultured Desulfosarcina sp.]|uniref:hypothetical protein n=1 Tax=uncultured Desulfosarcina sp. TaxID=218289 RepID=UPI0029C6C3FB|nr:hypothetical protein [uncultured Desulfosarcina sp.]